MVTVLKVGGSLFDLPDLGDRLLGLSDGPLLNSPVLLVPGGGGLADRIRELDAIHHWPASVAHQLGLLAMSIGARMIGALSPRFEVVNSFTAAARAWERERIPVLDVVGLAGMETLPESWDVTSDSIAAWVALQFPPHQLLLAKSTRLPSPAPDSESAADAGLVDRYFPVVAQMLRRVEWVNLRQSPLLTLPWWDVDGDLKRPGQ
jgi:aspartokinase-like uncharacterized kinase